MPLGILEDSIELQKRCRRGVRVHPRDRKCISAGHPAASGCQRRRALDSVHQLLEQCTRRVEAGRKPKGETEDDASEREEKTDPPLETHPRPAVALMRLSASKT